MLRPPLPRDCIAWFEYYLITITLTINALKVAGSLRSYNTMGKLVYEVVLHVSVPRIFVVPTRRLVLPTGLVYLQLRFLSYITATGEITLGVPKQMKPGLFKKAG
jgi:hypothetical protein